MCCTELAFLSSSPQQQIASCKNPILAGIGTTVAKQSTATAHSPLVTVKPSQPSQTRPSEAGPSEHAEGRAAATGPGLSQAPVPQSNRKRKHSDSKQTDASGQDASPSAHLNTAGAGKQRQYQAEVSPAVSLQISSTLVNAMTVPCMTLACNLQVENPWCCLNNGSHECICIMLQCHDVVSSMMHVFTATSSCC